MEQSHRKWRGTETAGVSASPAPVFVVACVTKPASSGVGADSSRYVDIGTCRSIAHRTLMTPRALRIIMISAVGADPVSWLHSVILLPAPRGGGGQLPSVRMQPTPQLFFFPTLVSSAIKADSVLRQQWPRGMYNKVSLTNGWDACKAVLHRGRSQWGRRTCMYCTQLGTRC